VVEERGTRVSEPPARSPSTPEPLEAIRAFWQDLGLPGLFDVHVHFLPPNVQAKVYAQFDQAGPKIGREWPIRYRGSHEERVEQLRSFGVRRFSALPYAHRPGIATYLNDWARDFAGQVAECLWSATFYPEPGAASYVGDLIESGVEVFKLHAQVGEFRLDDPLLDQAFGLVEDAGTPIVIHVGSGPVGNEFTGPEHLARLLRRHPRLPVVIAHMGAPEYAEFLTLAETHEHTRLDTTMVFTGFFDQEAPYPDELLPRLADLGDRVLLGSDFPTIPYPYLEQLHGLTRLAGRHPGLGEEWLRRVCWHNGFELFGPPRRRPGSLRE
jgi:predicted TIM-barrel fold metal-dependent hydrolase